LQIKKNRFGTAGTDITTDKIHIFILRL